MSVTLWRKKSTPFNKEMRAGVERWNPSEAKINMKKKMAESEHWPLLPPPPPSSPAASVPPWSLAEGGISQPTSL